MRFCLRALPVCLTILVAALVMALTSAPAFALHCYELTLKDEKGVVIPVSPPVIGLMLGGNPVIGDGVPPHATLEPAAPADCPLPLVEGIRNLYNASCLSEAARKKAATEGGATVERIKKGCEDMAASLQGKDVEFYKKRDEKLFPKKKEDSIFPKNPARSYAL